MSWSAGPQRSCVAQGRDRGSATTFQSARASQAPCLPPSWRKQVFPPTWVLSQYKRGKERARQRKPPLAPLHLHFQVLRAWVHWVHTASPAVSGDSKKTVAEDQQPLPLLHSVMLRKPGSAQHRQGTWSGLHRPCDSAPLGSGRDLGRE